MYHEINNVPRVCTNVPEGIEKYHRKHNVPQENLHMYQRGENTIDISTTCTMLACYIGIKEYGRKSAVPERKCRKNK